MLESLFNKVTGLKACNFIKKRLQRRNFTVKFAKFSKTTCFTEHLWWLFLALFLRSTCCPQINYYQCLTGCIQRQPSRGVPRKRCSENMQQICKAILLKLQHGCSPVFLMHIFRTTFPSITSGGLLLNVLIFRTFWSLLS